MVIVTPWYGGDGGGGEGGGDGGGGDGGGGDGVHNSIVSVQLYTSLHFGFAESQLAWILALLHGSREGSASNHMSVNVVTPEMSQLLTSRLKECACWNMEFMLVTEATSQPSMSSLKAVRSLNAELVLVRRATSQTEMCPYFAVAFASSANQRATTIDEYES